jgi:hypothetical protein
MSDLYGSAAPFQRSYSNQKQQSYISAQPFNTKLLNYSTSINSQFQTVGTLTVNPLATATNCPANRILNSTGRVLIPGANPGINSPLVGVYDPISGLNGFIDPTDPTFGTYNTTLPNQYNLGISSVIATVGGQGANARIGVDSGLLVATSVNGGVQAGNASIGQFQPYTGAVGTSTITVSSSQIINTSRIFLTQAQSSASQTGFSTLVGGTPVVPTVSGISTGFFVVRFPSPLFLNDDRTFNWVVM